MSRNSAGTIIFVVIGIAVIVGLYAMKFVERHDDKVRNSIQEMQRKQNQQQWKERRDNAYDKDSHLQNDHEWVELGLSVKWATCNIGASTPEESGDYFAWGETETKSYYDWSTYKWCNGDYDSFTKYNSDRSLGIVDNKTRLDLFDDVAHVKWGGSWRTPTEKIWRELLDKCNWSWTGSGYKVTGPNGNSIFLPASGERDKGYTHDVGSVGFYWSSSLSSDYQDSAWFMSFDSEGYDMYDGNRCWGLSVRPVCD